MCTQRGGKATRRRQNSRKFPVGKHQRLTQPENIAELQQFLLEQGRTTPGPPGDGQEYDRFWNENQHTAVRHDRGRGIHHFYNHSSGETGLDIQ